MLSKQLRSKLLSLGLQIVLSHCVAFTMSFFRFDHIICRSVYAIRLLQTLSGCSSLGFLHGLIGLLAQYGNLLLRGRILLGV